MGNIYRKVSICGLTQEGKQRGCIETEALIDTGATKTVISQAIANQLKVPELKLGRGTVTLNGEPVRLKLAGVELKAPHCDLQPIVVAISDRAVARAGRDPKDQNIQVILGHDYLQNARAGISYSKPPDSAVSCPKPKRRRTRR